MNELFHVYKEPEIFSILISIFSTFNYFLIILTALYMFRLAYYAKSNKILTHKGILFFAINLSLLNYNYGFYLNILPLSIIYISLAYMSYKWIKSKSLKWINLSMCIFILFIFATYNLFNTLVHRITYPFFSTNDILEYSFQFKSYFQAYNPKYSVLLGKVRFAIDGGVFELMNEPIEFRVYIFYYVLNCIGILFWLIIYFDILKKHNLYFKRDKSGQKSNFFFVYPENLNPILQEPSYAKKLAQEVKESLEDKAKQVLDFQKNI